MDRREFLVGAVTLPVALRFAPEALAGGTPVALVTADPQARVAVVELSTGKILRSIATVAGPRCIAAGAKARHAFVTDSGAHEVVTVDVLSGRTVARVNVGGPARHVSIDPSYKMLWVSLGSKAEEMAVVDVSRPHAPRLVRRFRPPFLAHDVGIAPGGRHVWVSSGDRGALAVYDRRTAEVLRRLPADAPPQHVTFFGSHADVTSGGDGTLRVLALKDGQVVRTTKVPEGSYNVQEAFGWIV